MGVRILHASVPVVQPVPCAPSVKPTGPGVPVRRTGGGTIAIAGRVRPGPGSCRRTRLTTAVATSRTHSTATSRAAAAKGRRWGSRRFTSAGPTRPARPAKAIRNASAWTGATSACPKSAGGSGPSRCRTTTAAVRCRCMSGGTRVRVPRVRLRHGPSRTVRQGPEGPG